MEILENHFQLEDSNLTQANYIFFNLKKNLPLNEYGIVLLKFRLKNGNEYCLVIESNNSDKIDYIKSYILEDEKMDLDLFKEYFLNKNEKLLKIKNEAYFRVINLDNKEETKYVFSDYNDAIDYLEMLDNHSSSMKS